jgi:acyl-coenzyme A synthetase/AMP-(fatty) acid ligase
MFINHIYRHARQNPARLAVVNSGQEITYRRFANDIDAVRNFLMRTPLPKEGVVVIITSNLYHDWVRLLALQSLGHTTIAGTSWALIQSLDLQNIAGLVCYSDDDEAAVAFRSVQPDSMVVKLPARPMAGKANGHSPPPVPDDPFGDHIIYTSGTTGTYKKLLMRGTGIEARILDDSKTMSGRIRPEEVFHCHSLGPWTAAGYGFPFYCWYFGATIVFEQRADWADHFFDHPVTKTFFVPSLLEEFRQKGISRPADHPPLQIMCGGGFLNDELAREVKRILNCELVHAYGGSETITAMESLVEDADDMLWLMPCADTRIEIVDDDDCVVGNGVEGAIRIGTKPYAPSGYLDDPETTARYFRDGYFYPGDMGVQREDGRVRVLGRVSDVLNLGGQKIAIGPFEKAARSLLGVDNLCVFNQQTEDGKDMLIVVIEGDRLPDRSRLQALAQKVKHVPQIRYSLINTFPRGENGMMKVDRRQVLAMVRETFREAVTPT